MTKYGSVANIKYTFNGITMVLYCKIAMKYFYKVDFNEKVLQTVMFTTGRNKCMTVA